jgi:hypothetical protein
MFNPRWPKAGPTGGLGFAFEALYNPQFFLPSFYSPKFWFKRF